MPPRAAPFRSSVGVVLLVDRNALKHVWLPMTPLHNDSPLLGTTTTHETRSFALVLEKRQGHGTHRSWLFPSSHLISSAFLRTFGTAIHPLAAATTTAAEEIVFLLLLPPCHSLVLYTLHYLWLRTCPVSTTSLVVVHLKRADCSKYITIIKMCEIETANWICFDNKRATWSAMGIGSLLPHSDAALAAAAAAAYLSASWRQQRNRLSCRHIK